LFHVILLTNQGGSQKKKNHSHVPIMQKQLGK
jgi:hypothetical protein